MYVRVMTGKSLIHCSNDAISTTHRASRREERRRGGEVEDMRKDRADRRLQREAANERRQSQRWSRAGCTSAVEGTAHARGRGRWWSSYTAYG